MPEHRAATKQTTAWLIERGQPEQQAPTVWWVGDPEAKSREGEEWTQDAWQATRFDSKAKADRVVNRLFVGPLRDVTARATEHIFCETRRVVIGFVLPSNGERWNWPIEGDDSINAFVEILDRANIAWTVTSAT